MGFANRTKYKGVYTASNALYHGPGGPNCGSLLQITELVVTEQAVEIEREGATMGEFRFAAASFV